MKKDIIFKLVMLKGEKGDIGYYDDSGIKQDIKTLSNRIDAINAGSSAGVSDNKISTQIQQVQAREGASGDASVWYTFTIPENATIIEASYCPVIEGLDPDTLPWKTKDIELFIINSTSVQVQVKPYSISDSAYLKISYAHSVAIDLSEVEDIRIGADGIMYQSAGSAVRTQISEIKDTLNEYEGIFTSDVDESIKDWLDNHPEATTTVQDGSISYDKLDNKLKVFSTPEMFGAVGNGIADDTNAMQAALDASKHVILDGSKNYYCDGIIVINDGTTLEMNGATISAPDSESGIWQIFNFHEDDVYTEYNGNGNIIIRNGHFLRSTISFIHGKDIIIENCRFENARRSHFIEICACKNFIVRNCSFYGMTLNYTPAQAEYINIDNARPDHFPHAPEGSALFDGTPNDGILIDNCIFDINNKIMQNAVGKHAYYDSEDPTASRAKNITVRNCSVYGATEEAFLFRGSENVIIDGCKSYGSARLYQFWDCDSLQVVNSTADNITNPNIIRNSINAMIHGNFIYSKTVDCWDLQIQGISSYINYSNNYFVNTIGGRSPVSAKNDAVITEFSAIANVYRVNGGHYGTLSNPAADSNVSITFGQVDDIYFGSPQNAFTMSNPIIDLTNFNRMVIEVGAPSYNTLSTITVDALKTSGTESHFGIGNKFIIPVNMLSTGEAGLCTIEITDAHTLKSTGQKIRFVKLQKI